MTMDDNSNQDRSPFDEYREPFIEEPSEEEPVKKGPNRTFITIVAVVGAVLVLTVLALVAIVLIGRNTTAKRFAEQAAQINATNTVIAQVQLETAAAESKRMTEKALPPTWTPTSPAPSNTPRPVMTSTTAAGVIDSAARTATIAAFLTQVSANTAAPTVTSAVQQATTAVVRSATPRGTVRATSTALPTTGFAEDAGLPGMFGLALALVVIIVLVRRLRLSSSQ